MKVSIRSSNLKLRKTILSVLLLALVMCYLSGCTNNENGISITRYNLIIVSTSIPDRIEIEKFGGPIFIEDMAYLPDKDSKLILIDCSGKEDTYDLYIEKPCTGIQMSAGTCDSITIVKSFQNLIASIAYENTQNISNCDENSKFQALVKFINDKNDLNKYKRFYYSKADSANQLLGFSEGEIASKILFNNSDSLMNNLKNAIIEHTKIILFHEPPTKLSEKAPSWMNEKKTIKAIPKYPTTETTEKSSDNNPIDSKPTKPKDLKIGGQGTYFDWTDMGDGIKYEIEIKDKDTQERIGSSSITEENSVDITRYSLSAFRNYTITVRVINGKKKQCRKVEFDLTENLNINPDCKFKNDGC